MRPQVKSRFGAALLAAVAAAAVASPSASADGRALEGAFCGPTCMALTSQGTTYGTDNRTALALRPGTYWLTVTDAFTFHNYSLRSCDGGASPCASGSVTDITSVPFVGGTVTDPLLLTPGGYRLFCKVGAHEAQGMYVDFTAGGVGQDL